MSKQKTQVFYEIHVTVPVHAPGETDSEYVTSVFGPYETLRHVKLAKANNIAIRWRTGPHRGGRMVVKKITRVYTDTVEEVEI